MSPLTRRVLTVNLIALGIILPILPFYVTEFDPNPEVAALIFSVFSGASLLTAPLWGRLSDHIGRKPVLLISVAGTCASYIWLANADALWEVFASRGFAGATYANPGDCTPSEPVVRQAVDSPISAAIGRFVESLDVLSQNLYHCRIEHLRQSVELDSVGDRLDGSGGQDPGHDRYDAPDIRFVLAQAFRAVYVREEERSRFAKARVIDQVRMGARQSLCLPSTQASTGSHRIGFRSGGCVQFRGQVELLQEAADDLILLRHGHCLSPSAKR